MPQIMQLPTHVANLIAAGEVVERPASVVKELLENAVDAGASQITLEIRDGGMTFLRLTDNGCGMAPEDARKAFLRHATSKLRTAEDLAAIATFGFRGEALAAIASVSRIDLMTKTPGSLLGTSLRLEAGTITEESEVGCPDGTTIIVRDLFYNTPARMKFMKSDTVEAGRVAAAVQQQALAHPEVAIRFLRDGKEVLSTPGNGGLEGAVYCVYGRECAKMVKVQSRWDAYSLTGYVSKPTDARPSRSMQTFFVNDRPVKSKLLISALEEAYRNQLMVGKFPACVLHLTVPPAMVDVNVHPAKTEVKFLNEKGIFDCVHYGVLGALNRTPDRPQVQFREPRLVSHPEPREAPGKGTTKAPEPFATMPARDYRAYVETLASGSRPRWEAAGVAAEKVEQAGQERVRETVTLPRMMETPPEYRQLPREKASPPPARQPEVPFPQGKEPEPEPPEQVALEMPPAPQWRMVGELYRSYILVEEGDDAFLIDKHAAHERILFDKLKANPEAITGQTLLTPIPVRLSPEAVGELLANGEMLGELGFEIEEFGENTVLVRQIPMDLNSGQAGEALEEMGAGLLSGRREGKDTVRDEILHTVACKAAIKAGWVTSDAELLALVKQVMAREDLKYCPHGRPICVSLSKKQLEKQFKRT